MNLFRTVMRWAGDDDIYLLRRRQMNGTHAELFTYCLYQRIKSQDDALPFFDITYASVMGAYDEPHITLLYRITDTDVRFDVHYVSSQYRISTSLASGEIGSELQDLLLSNGYTLDDSVLQKNVPQSAIDTELQHLGDNLSNTHEV